MKDRLLILDASINLILGLLLLLVMPFPTQITAWFGVPPVEQAFYPSILGAVLVGIGLSLLIESQRATAKQPAGLGLAGAIAINLCGGLALLGWLVFGSLDLPLRGKIFLWLLALLLVVISGVELLAQVRK